MTRAYNRDAHMTRAEADAHLSNIFGVSGRAEHDASQEKSFPDYALDSAQKIIDGEWGGVDIAAKHASWARFEAWRRGPGGRPSSVSGRTMLIVLLMHAIANEPMSIKHMAHTLFARLTLDQRGKLGIAECTFDGLSWYNRLWTAYQQLLEPIDPCPYPDYPRGDTTPTEDRITLHRKLTAKQREQLYAWRETIGTLLNKRRTRLDDLMFEMNANFLRHVRATTPLLDKFTGDVALDATFTLVHGKGTSPESTRVAGSTNLEAGWYIRDGNHSPNQTIKPTLKEGRATVKVTKKKFGFETDLVTMTNGDKLVPDFILGTNLHSPGAITEVAETLFSRIPRLGFEAGTISVDMAYPYLEPKSFHIPLMQAGYDFAFHIRNGELGARSAYSVNDKPTTGPDGKKKPGPLVSFIHVEGTWYLEHMPDNLADAVKHSRLDPSHKDYIDEETLKERLKSRSDYKLTSTVAARPTELSGTCCPTAAPTSPRS